MNRVDVLVGIGLASVVVSFDAMCWVYVLRMLHLI